MDMSHKGSPDQEEKHDFFGQLSRKDVEEPSMSEADLPQGRQLGLVSAIFLMINRMVGTGVFATTSTILSQSGSVGMSLL
jgi:hypothetical protein